MYLPGTRHDDNNKFAELFPRGTGYGEKHRDRDVGTGDYDDDDDDGDAWGK